MPIAFGRFVVIQALGIAAMNTAINASYTWLLWRGRESLPLEGAGGIAFDLASTPVWIAVLSALLGTASIRAKLRDGRIGRPAMRPLPILGLLPRSVALRSVVLGAAAAIALALPLRWALQASGVEMLPLAVAILVKIAITAPLSLAIVPLVILAALSDMQRLRPAPVTA